MSLMKSLNSGVSGLRGFQTKMDIIGNNIANVETIGFKSSRISFSEMLNQTISSSGGSESAPTSAAQVGLGVRISSISRNFNQGSLQSTGRATDIAIEGDGFFMVSEGEQKYLTRAGNFDFNKDGFLVDQAGRFVQGYNADTDGNIVNSGTTGDVRVDFENVYDPQSTQNVFAAGNVDAEATDPQTMSTTVYDGLGDSHTLVIDLTPQAAANEWEYEASFLNGETVTTGATGTLEFDSTGELVAGNSFNIEFDPGNGADTVAFTMNFGNPADGSRMTQFSGSNSATIVSQDGYAQGKLVDFNIDDDGYINGVYDNGRNAVLAQIALGDVSNPLGLEMVGNGLYRGTESSGEVSFTTASEMSETSMNSGVLEGSNVDLAREFTDMITSQRAYQSNARVITTADELLQEVVNLKR